MTNPPTESKGKHRTTAQAMVEFGLALPVLLLVVYGLIETGRLVLIYASVVSAARQAVRYGSVSGNNGSGTPYYNDCSGIRAAAMKLGFLQRIKAADILISYDEGPGGTVLSTGCPLNVAGHPINGDRIRVEVSANYSPIVPLVPFGPFPIISGGNRTLLIGVPISIDVPPVIPTPGGGGGGGGSPIRVTKSATVSPSCTPGLCYQNVGDVITYKYTLYNDGSDPASGISLTDSVLGNVSCSVSDPLPGGNSATCTKTYTTTQTDVSNQRTITNHATFSASINGNPVSVTSLDVNVPFHGAAHLSLTKVGVAPETIGVGELISYTFTLKNDGNVTLKAPFIINDALFGGSFTCSGNTLAVGATLVCPRDYPLTSGDISAGVVTNTANATAMYLSDTYTSNSASTTVYVPPLLLSLDWTPTGVSALPQNISYTYTLKNRTDFPMTNVSLTDSYPSSTRTCGTASLAAHQSTTCTRTYAVTQADMNAGSIADTVSAKATLSGKTTNSNAITATVTVSQSLKLQLAKTANPTAPPNGATTFTLPANITYSYLLTNTGNVTLTSPYTVTDDKVSVSCAAATGDMAPGASISCTDAVYALKQSDLDTGFLRNTATATAKTKVGGLIVISPPQSALVITYTGARLGLLKIPNPPYWSFSGQVINYTFTLVNHGGKPLSGPFSIVDNKLDTSDCSAANQSGSIPLGGSVQCFGTYTIKSSDPANATIKNQATATAYDGATAVTGTQTAAVPRFVCSATLLKHRNPTPIPNGSTILWTLANYTGLPVHIASVSISWTGNAALNAVLLGGSTIWSGSQPFSFSLPGGPWLLPTGVDTVMQFNFSQTARSVHVVLTFTETDCGTVDSNITYSETP